MSMPSKKLFLASLCSVLLAGCVSFDEVSKTISDSRASAEGAVAQQNQMRKSGAVVRMGSAKLAGNEVPVKVAQQLPQGFNRPFAYLSAHQPLSAILGEVGRRTGMATAIQPSDKSGSNAAAAAPTAPGMPNFSGGADVPIAVDWNGDLKGLLDYLATTTRMYWKYEDGRIYFFKTDTRSFHVFLPAGKRAVKSSISLTGSGNGGGGNGGSATGGSGSGGTSGSSAVGGTVDVASSMEIDAYDAIIRSVQAIVSATEGTQAASAGGAALNAASTNGSKNVVANPSLGLITVTGTPEILDRVANYVRSVNDRFAQNVMIGVKVYNLTVNKGVNAGVSLQAAYRSLTDRLGVTLAGAPNMAPLNGAIPGTLVIDAVSGNWTGSQLLLQAMEQIGNVQYVTSGQVIAANGQPSPLQVATEFSYVSARGSQGTGQPGDPRTITTTSSIRSVGFTANFLPLILGDNRIMLQYQVNLSSLISLDTFGVGDNAIQIPRVATQSLQQQAFLKDGQSIVLLGFEQERAQLDKATGLTGISKNAGSDRNLMVIVMEVYSGK